MESKEILKEFAGKLAGLSAAAKAVAIAGAVSAYSGTGYAAEKVSVKAENRFITVVEPQKSDTASNAKKEESVAAKTEEVVAPKISEEAVKTLSASKEQDIAKVADAKATKVVKANIAPKIQEKVEIYEPKKTSESKPKYDTKYYRAPGTGVTSDRTSRSTGSASPSTRYDYDTPTSASYVATSSDEAFDERASSGSSSVNSGRAGRSYGRNHGRTRTYSESSYGSGSRNTVSRDKTDDTGKENMSTGSKGGVTATASSAKPAGAVSFSGFSDPVGGSSAPKIDARAERAVKILDRIESGESKLVEAGKAERALRTQKKIDDKEKKLVDYNDEVAVLNDTKREELQRLQAELRDTRARYVELQRQIEPLRIQQTGSFSPQPQPIVQDENNGIGAVQPIATQEQNPAEPGQVDVLPDAAQAPKVDQAAPEIPPPPPPPLLVLDENGRPVPPPGGVMPGRPAEPDFDALLAGAMTKIDEEIKREKEELEKKAEQAAKEESDIFEAVNGVVNAVNDPSKNISEDYYTGIGFRLKLGKVASQVYKQAITNPEELPAFCNSCMKVLVKAGSTEITEKATKVYKTAVEELSAYLSLAVAHSADIGGDNVENDPCGLLDKCFKKYDVKLPDVKKKAKAIRQLSDENYNKCQAVWDKLTSNDPGALADAVDGNQCSLLDRAIFSALGKSERAGGWYTDEDVKSEVEEKRRNADEFGKSDLNEDKKGELMRLFEDLNKVFWISNMSDDFINADNRASASGKCKKLETKIIKEIFKNTKVPQLIAFKGELKVKWDELSAKFKGRERLFMNLTKGVKGASDDKFNYMFYSAERNFERSKKDYEKVKLYPFISKLRRAVMDGEKNGKLILKFDGGDLALMKEKIQEVKKLFETILVFSKRTEWILDGEWLSTFLSALPKDNVTSLTITGGTTDNGKEVTCTDLRCLSSRNCSRLGKLTFKNVALTKNALGTLKLRGGVELIFEDVEALDHYKGEGALKQLIDAGVKVGAAPWIKEGVQPPPVAAAQPGQPGAAANLQPINQQGLAGNQQRPVNQQEVAPHGNNQGYNWPQLKKKPANLEPQANKVDLLELRKALKGINVAERDDAVLEHCKEMWERDERDSIDVDIPILMFELGAKVEAIVAEAVRCANGREKPLVLTGDFNDTHDGEIGMDVRGSIVKSMHDLHSPLKIKFSSPAGYSQKANTLHILQTILNKRTDMTNIKSVEIVVVPPEKEVLEKLGDLGLDEVIFSNPIDNAQGDPQFGEIRFDEGTEDALKHLFMHTKKIDLAGNKIPGGVLAKLAGVIKSMKPANDGNEDGNDDGNPQANAPKPALEELVLPDSQDAQEMLMINRIRALVDELKRGA